MRSLLALFEWQKSAEQMDARELAQWEAADFSRAVPTICCRLCSDNGQFLVRLHTSRTYLAHVTILECIASDE
jgi:hypothetical protein